MARRRLIFATVGVALFGAIAFEAYRVLFSHRRGHQAISPSGPSEPAGRQNPHGPRPNLVVIMTDDQENQTLQYMPRTTALIGRQGVTFTDFQTSFPLCCPSRATFLTGQYAHNHHVFGDDRQTGAWQTFHRTGAESRTLPVALQRAGYSTGFVGKYLNQWGLNRDHVGAVPPPVPPGWTDFTGLVGGSIYNMWGYTLDHNGRDTLYTSNTQDAGAYQTDVLTQAAVQDIYRYAKSPRPFMLGVFPTAPHSEENRSLRPGYIRPAPRDANLYPNLPLYRTPSFNEANISDKPPYIRRHPLLSPRKIRDMVARNRARVLSLQSVDDMVARVVAALQATGRLNNTVIMFTSDNGWLQGQHRIPGGKIFPYGNSPRVPLIVRGPGFMRNVQSSAVAANIDLAPTLLQLAHARPLISPDGISLLPILRGTQTGTGRDLVLENFSPPGQKYATYQALRTGSWLYVHYFDKTQGIELYDLRSDPDNLRNLAYAPRYAGVVRSLAQRLAAIKNCAGAACRGQSRRARKPTGAPRP